MVGRATFRERASVAVVQTVSLVGTTTVVTSSLNPSTVGQSVTFTATVSGTSSGTVTFKDGGTTLGTGTVNAVGVATYTTAALSVAAHSITAEYGRESDVSGKSVGRGGADGESGGHDDRGDVEFESVDGRSVGDLHGDGERDAERHGHV